MKLDKFRIFDCFPFLDELEILDLRLSYLKEIADIIVIAQNDFTHRGDQWHPILDLEHKLIKKYMRNAKAEKERSMSTPLANVGGTGSTLEGSSGSQ